MNIGYEYLTYSSKEVVCYFRFFIILASKLFLFF